MTILRTCSVIVALTLTSAGAARADGSDDPVAARASCEKQKLADSPEKLKQCCDDQILTDPPAKQAKLVAQCVAGGKAPATKATRTPKKPAK